MIKTLKKYISPFRKIVYSFTGKKPWSYGYIDVRWELIAANIRNKMLLKAFANNAIPQKYAIGFDERLVEYPWIFSRLSNQKGSKLLDAGSTFNFHQLVSSDTIKNKDLTIFTFYPEPNNYISQRISYVFGDLRAMPFNNQLFDEIVCQSTIEHVDMDNSIYGYSINKNEDEATKSYEYLKVIDELLRVLKSKGKLLLTFPYGKFENHGFFQQFDAEMVNRILQKMNSAGISKDFYLKYTIEGWINSDAQNCDASESFNPHTGKGKGNDNAAHSRAICCIELIKN